MNTADKKLLAHEHGMGDDGGASPRDIHAAITFRDQRESPLLQLPGELRNKIYGYVFHVPRIHACPRGPCRVHPLKVFHKSTFVHYSQGLLSVLTACRQIYAEAKLFPIALNEFCGDSDMIPKLDSCLTDAQLNRITSLRIYIIYFPLTLRRSPLVQNLGHEPPYAGMFHTLARWSGLERIVVGCSSTDYKLSRRHMRRAIERGLEGVGRADVKVKVKSWCS